MTRPNLFIVGAPRSGTTSMFNYLKAHPDIAMGARKEPHFFSDDLVDPGFVGDEAGYLDLFLECGESRFVGEASVWYMYSRRAAGRIHEFNPDARMIALLRNPVDMLPSIHAHHVYTGFQEIQDFRIAYQDQGTSGQGGESFRHHLDYSQIARYGDQLERFVERSGRDGIHVSLHDDLTSDVSKVYRSIIDFLGLQPGPLPQFRRFNPQRRSRNKAVSGLHQRMTSRKAIRPRPSSRVGSVWRKGETTVTKIVGRLNAAEVIRPPVDPEMRQKIIADYRDDILKLSGLIDRDLSHWLK